MIRPLRARHRWMIATLGVAVGTLGVIGLLARRPVPKMVALPPAVAEIAFGELRVRGSVTLGPEGDAWLSMPDAGRLAELRLALYWTDVEARIREALPGRAFWMGAWSGATPAVYRVPSTQPGTLLLYSLARQEIVDVATVRLPPAAVGETRVP